MSLFLSAGEKSDFESFRSKNDVGDHLFQALRKRVNSRLSSSELHSIESEIEWWYCSAEFLSDAAVLFALGESAPELKSWIRDATLSLTQRSQDDWIGPRFRDHRTTPACGNLETAHLSWAMAVTLDLAPEAFSEPEKERIRECLRDRAIPLCRQWLERFNHVANWRCVMGAGVAVAAAVLDDDDSLEFALKDYQLQVRAFQDDGSYGESLQYANYAALHLTLTREALLRRRPDFTARLPEESWVLQTRWQAASLLFQKPLTTWGETSRARSANFNDSSSFFRPSADVLLHIASKHKDKQPTAAGIARWLFDTLYAKDLQQGPHDSATFGFINDFGFLTPALIAQAVKALSPADAPLSHLEVFSCGDVIARDAWNGTTCLAVHGGGDPLNGPGHLHGDLNSFILSHRNERLLVDPGHSCYRNLIHGLEGSTRTHNTCTFLLSADDGLGLQEDKADDRLLEQSRTARVHFDPVTRKIDAPFNRGARRFLAASEGPVRVIGSDAAALYGEPITLFSRIWILCGSNVLFIVDQVNAKRPVRTAWHWLFNNRDGRLSLEFSERDCSVTSIRPLSSMKLYHLGSGLANEPENAYVHDAYHTYPNGKGEGVSGSGKLLTIREPNPAKCRTTIHAIAMDSSDAIRSWHLDRDGKVMVLKNDNLEQNWSLAYSDDQMRFRINESYTNRSWSIHGGENWTFKSAL